MKEEEANYWDTENTSNYWNNYAGDYLIIGVNSFRNEVINDIDCKYYDKADQTHNEHYEESIVSLTNTITD